MKQVLKIALALLLSWSLETLAQQYNFRNYSVKEGVAQSQVYSAIQDSRGYLWLGTRGGGITRYDGLKFKTFTKKDGLASNYIFCLKESIDGNLIIGTNNGLTIYNGLSFTNYGSIQKDTTQFWVLDLAIGANSEIWLATNQGVYLFKSGKMRNISESLGEKPLMINTIATNKKGDIFYGTALGLHKLEKNGEAYNLLKIYKSPQTATGSVNTLKFDRQGRLWIGTYGNGPFYFQNDTAYRPLDDPFLNRQSVFDIFIEDDDNIWFATLNSGVGIYNSTARSVNWLDETEGLSNNHVRCIIKDKSGNYWFGTSGGGVCNYFGNQFTTFDKTSGLSGNFIYSIFKDSRDRLFIGTSDKGFCVLDSGKFKAYGNAQGFGDFKVKAICENEKGQILLGTEANGVFVFTNDTFISVKGLERKYIRSILKHVNGDIYVATAGTGIYILKGDNLDSNQIHLGIGDGLPSNRVSCLHQDKTGKIWFGTENNGIGFIRSGLVDKEIFTISDGMPSNAVRCMTEDKDGVLWIGTAGNGIASMPLYEGISAINTYDYKNGLNSSNIYLLTMDGNGSLIAGSETGLDLITFDKNNKIIQVKHYSKGEGFTGIETCQNAVFKEPNGTIWFGTINGLIKYKATDKFKNTYAPVTSILDVRLYYEPLSKTGFKKFVGPWNSIENIVLPYNKNHLTFDFIGINFNNPEAVSYKWKLLGFDDNWSPPSNQNTVTYSNLPPGNYQFLVISCNEDGIWNKTPKSIYISITPPFWQKTWVIVMGILILIGLVYLIFKIRINAVRRKLKLEKDLIELERKALRLQMNPHFIFNALNSIQSQIGFDDGQTARYYLAKFARLMRQILDNSRSVTISLQEEINTLENYLLIERFSNGDRFDYEIIIQEGLETDFIQIPPMLLQPFIENAIKHGLKHMLEKRGKITLEIKEENGLLVCSVEDNGIGREVAESLKKSSKETYHKSTAMIVTKERLEAYKNTKGMNSFEIIDLKDTDGKPAGTKVIIRIPLD